MSQTDRAFPSQPANLYNRFFEYSRVVSSVSVTEEGVFKAGQVPTSYGGARLDLLVVHSISLINARGEMQIFEIEVEEGMDDQRQRGGPVVRDGTEVRAGAGPSTVPITQTTILNSNLDASRRVLGEVSTNVFKSDLAATPGQPPA